MKVVVANDHGAVERTKEILEHLKTRGIEYTYLGTAEEKSVDYPDMAEKAVTEYRKGGYDYGILLCGTGIGISLAANKMKGIRCALVENVYASVKTREHNNSNFIAFGGRIDYSEPVLDMLDAFLDTPFSNEERHIRRIEKMMALEGK